MTSVQLKAKFSVEDKHGPFYRGGVVKVSRDGQKLFCQCGNQVKIVDFDTGKESSVIGQEEDDAITSFALSPDDEILVVASRNLLLKQWNWKQNISMRTWKAIHTGPVSSMAFDVTSTLLATGGADATVKVWDVIRHHCTHNLRGHSGVVSIVAFHPDINRLQLVSAGDDCHVRVWNLQTSTCLAALEGHYSVVTAFQFSPTGDRLYSAARDSVVIVWDLEKLSKMKIIPVYEPVEALVLLPSERQLPSLNVKSDDPHFVTGGSKGILRVWNCSSCRCVYPACDQAAEGSEVGASVGAAITAAELQPALDSLYVVTYDHNIFIHGVADLAVQKQFVGYNDDVLDMQFFGEKDSHLVVATNSDLVKVFEVATWSVQVLRGHTDIVLCVGVNRQGLLLATGSKDNSVRVWRMEADTRHIECVAVAHGHTHAVNSVAFSRFSDDFLISVSHDCTLKRWTLPEDFSSGSVQTLQSTVTEHAHEKEINTVAVTPNDKMVATGSQDKTAKLWVANTLRLLGVFRGHKRGVWCVQFSPVDQALATASADTTIKIWALSDYSCVKTFEGHESSVLRLHFLTRGMQMVSSGSDGLVKLWTIKSSECVGTWDEHDEKVWALAVSRDEQTLMTGAGDSTICVWKDVTEEEQQEAIKKQEEFIQHEQQLLNLLHKKKYLKAMSLAIRLNQPFRVLNIIKDILETDTGREDTMQTLSRLRDDQMDTVLGFCSTWNTNSKHCHVAQLVLQVALTSYPPDKLLQLPNMRANLEALLPYTERHFQRMNRLLQQSTFVDFTWQSMKLVDVSSGDNEAGVSTSTPALTSKGNEDNAESPNQVQTGQQVQLSSSDDDESDSDSDHEPDSVTATSSLKSKRPNEGKTSRPGQIEGVGHEAATSSSEEESSEGDDGTESSSLTPASKPTRQKEGNAKRSQMGSEECASSSSADDDEDDDSDDDDEDEDESSDDDVHVPKARGTDSRKSISVSRDNHKKLRVPQKQLEKKESQTRKQQNTEAVMTKSKQGKAGKNHTVKTVNGSTPAKQSQKQQNTQAVMTKSKQGKAGKTNTVKTVNRSTPAKQSQKQPPKKITPSVKTNKRRRGPTPKTPPSSAKRRKSMSGQ